MTFATMTAEEARTYLREFVGDQETVLTRFFNAARFELGPVSALKRAHLLPAWRATRTLLAEPAPVQSVTEAPGWVTLRGGTPGAEHPSAFWIAEAVGRLVAQSLLNAHPSAHWDVGPADRMFRNEPRVAGLVNELSVLAAGVQIVFAERGGRPRFGDDWLVREYDLKCQGVSMSSTHRPVVSDSAGSPSAP
jgi:hypothetical protein